MKLKFVSGETEQCQNTGLSPPKEGWFNAAINQFLIFMIFQNEISHEIFY